MRSGVATPIPSSRTLPSTVSQASQISQSSQHASPPALEPRRAMFPLKGSGRHPEISSRRHQVEAASSGGGAKREAGRERENETGVGAKDWSRCTAIENDGMNLLVQRGRKMVIVIPQVLSHPIRQVSECHASKDRAKAHRYRAERATPSAMRCGRAVGAGSRTTRGKAIKEEKKELKNTPPARPPWSSA